MKYFSHEFQKFFKDLSRNNTKQWFDSNRTRYEEHVKQPFSDFVEEMIKLVQRDDPEVSIGAKEAIFRINRDIRFAKEKSPYNTYMAANISREGRRSKEWPGFYFQFSGDRLTVGGGAYVVEPATLTKIRRAIIGNLGSFRKIVTPRQFTSKYGALKGERNKILPPEFKDWAAKEPLLANKQFYFMTDLSDRILLEDDLPQKVMLYYRAGREVNSFLRRAITSKD